MSQLISAYVYGANSNDWNVPDGELMAFPVTSIVLRTLPEGTFYSGVECFTAIQLLPTAPSPIQPVYYTDSDLETLVELANTQLINPI